MGGKSEENFVRNKHNRKEIGEDKFHTQLQGNCVLLSNYFRGKSLRALDLQKVKIKLVIHYRE